MHKLLHVAHVLTRNERHGYNAADVHVRAIDVHVEFQLRADGLDVLQSFLVIRARAAHPDLDIVLIELRGELAQGADDAFEC